MPVPGRGCFAILKLVQISTKSDSLGPALSLWASHSQQVSRIRDARAPEVMSALNVATFVFNRQEFSPAWSQVLFGNRSGGLRSSAWGPPSSQGSY